MVHCRYTQFSQFSTTYAQSSAKSVFYPEKMKISIYNMTERVVHNILLLSWIFALMSIPIWVKINWNLFVTRVSNSLFHSIWDFFFFLNVRETHAWWKHCKANQNDTRSPKYALELLCSHATFIHLMLFQRVFTLRLTHEHTHTHTESSGFQITKTFDL